MTDTRQRRWTEPTTLTPEWKPNARPDRLIDWFDDFDGPNRFSFLSNFHQGLPIVVPDRVTHPATGLVLLFEGDYPTGEHAFQAMKAVQARDFVRIVNAAGPSEAKKLGRRVPLRADWEQVKYDVMRAVIRHKFAPSRPEAVKLIATGKAYLREGTWWNDRTWGVDLSTPGHPGANWLGILLMEQRARLANGLA